MPPTARLAALLLTGCLSLGVAGAAERGEGGKRRRAQEIPTQPGTLPGRLCVENNQPRLVSGGRSYPLRLSSGASPSARSVLADIQRHIKEHARNDRRGLDWVVVRGRIEKDRAGSEYVLAEGIEVLPPIVNSKGKGRKKGEDAPEE